MSEETNTQTQEQIDEQNAAMANLLLKAERLGIKHNANIGFAKLQAKVSKVMADAEKENEDDEPSQENLDKVEALVSTPLRESTNQRNQRIRKECLLLTRVKITCHNPHKKKWNSEIFTASNGVSGTVKKVIPFDEPFHVPKILLTMIREREFQKFVDGKDATGKKIKVAKNLKEFSVEVLTPKTPSELKDIADRQALDAVANPK